MTRVIEAELFSPGNYFHGNSTQQCDSENTYNTKWLYALMVCNGFFCNGFADSLEKLCGVKLTGKVIAMENNVYK